VAQFEFTVSELPVIRPEPWIAQHSCSMSALAICRQSRRRLDYFRMADDLPGRLRCNLFRVQWATRPVLGNRSISI